MYMSTLVNFIRFIMLLAWILPNLGLIENHCCCELGRYAIALQLQPSPSRVMGLATSQMGNHGMNKGAIRDGELG